MASGDSKKSLLEEDVAVTCGLWANGCAACICCVISCGKASKRVALQPFRAEPQVFGDLIDQDDRPVGLIRLRRTPGKSVVSYIKPPGATEWGNPNEAIGW